MTESKIPAKGLAFSDRQDAMEKVQESNIGGDWVDCQMILGVGCRSTDVFAASNESRHFNPASCHVRIRFGAADCC